MYEASRASQGAISIHALLAESDQKRTGKVVKFVISIHALLAESDPAPPKQPTPAPYFYPRSPCGERPYFHRL